MSSAPNKKLIDAYAIANDALYLRAVQEHALHANSGVAKALTHKPQPGTVLTALFKEVAAKFIYGDFPTDLLGKGTYGQVFAIQAQQGGKSCSLAIKIVGLKATQDLCQKEMRELRLWRDYASKAPYTVRLLDHFFCTQQWKLPILNGLYAFVMPRAKGTLGDAIKADSINLKCIQSTIVRLIHALGAFAKMGMVHADIRPENILLDEAGNAWLGDFSSSRLIQEQHKGLMQSRWYRAPEVFLGMGFDGGIDMWGLGCVIYEMFTGEPPFISSGSEDTEVAIFLSSIHHLGLMVEEIGMPPAAWIAKSLPPYREEKILKLGMSKAGVSGKQPLWQKNIATCAREKGLSEENVQELLLFLSRIFCYDKRMRPQEALKMAFLQKEWKKAVDLTATAAAPAAKA